jgi:hypothetical protein
MSTYSYGRTGALRHNPTNDPDAAHRLARIASSLGESWEVHEYPPGGPQPGRLVATYWNGKIVQPGRPS